jgi:hypothetical protein
MGGGPAKVVKFTGSNHHDGVGVEELGLSKDPRCGVEAQLVGSHADPDGEV